MPLASNTGHIILYRHKSKSYPPLALLMSQNSMTVFWYPKRRHVAHGIKSLHRWAPLSLYQSVWEKTLCLKFEVLTLRLCTCTCNKPHLFPVTHIPILQRQTQVERLLCSPFSPLEVCFLPVVFGDQLPPPPHANIFLLRTQYAVWFSKINKKW